MYEETYEEYIRSILGYPTQTNTIPNGYMPNNMLAVNSNLENYYPKIYKDIYPKVRNICNGINGKVTEEQIDKMIEQIYNDFEQAENRNASNENTNARQTSKQDNREENRNSNNNSIIRDLIKILILRELLGNSRPPMRPPMPNPRPPFRPGFPMEPRSTVMPQNNFYQNLYE